MAVPANRRPLDARRFGAWLLDGLIFLPVVVWSMPYDLGVSLFATALFLVYHFLCEATTGQTVGKAVFRLRVVTLDGRIAGDRAIAARTVIRLFEGPVLGAIVLVCTGRRRQRLGDLAAKTCVVDARDVVASKPLSAGLLGYPFAWLAPALVVLVLTAQGHFPGSYRVSADEICQKADAIAPTLTEPNELLELTRRETEQLEAMGAPPNWHDRHEVLVAEYRTLSIKLERAIRRTMRSSQRQAVWQEEWARLKRRAERSNARLAAIGYKGCAGEETAT